MPDFAHGEISYEVCPARRNWHVGAARLYADPREATAEHLTQPLARA